MYKWSIMRPRMIHLALLALFALCLFIYTLHKLDHRWIAIRSPRLTNQRVPVNYNNRTPPRHVSAADTLSLPHTDLESQQSLSSSALERLDTYLMMSVTDNAHFVSGNHTEVTVLSGSTPRSVGDTLRVRIRLFDTEGRPVSTGGDYPRIWLKEPLLKANVNGYVIDHGNGTYTGVVLLPWEGNPEVIVSVANTRRHISLIMNNIEKNGVLYVMYSKFVDSSGKHSEETSCSPLQNGVQGCNSMGVCNVTSYNYGLPWFCCKPRSTFLTCDDIRRVQSGHDHTLDALALRVSRFQKHTRSVPIRIQVTKAKQNATHLSPRPVLCRERPRGDTWRDTTPIGYYVNNTWINLKCEVGTLKRRYSSCLKNKRFVILGDSNSRSIYKYLCSRSKATKLTKHYTTKKPWHKLLMAENKATNTDLLWAPHNQPFYVGPYQALDTMRSVGNWLDRTPTDKPVVVIIHLYYHLSRTTLSVYRAFVKDARAAIDRLLARAPDTTVFIQGPHSITFIDTREPLDYIRRCYEQIWFEEFKGIHDRVVYLDMWDITVGTESRDLHPSGKIMNDMTGTLLSYMCHED